jgi:hypothetical protein
MSSLIYPRPKASDYHVHRVLHDLQERTDVFLEYLDNPDQVLQRYDIDDDSHRLIKERDYQGLVARGIHPIIVVALQRRIEWGTSHSASADEDAAPA